MAQLPRGPLSSKWLGGTLVMSPGEITGSQWFVDSNTGASTNTGKSWDDALDTIDGAVNKCTASKGDIIWVHPHHAENLAADSAIDIDVVGVRVIGIRNGRQMPTLTATAAAGDCKLAAAGVSIQNLRFLGGIDATTGCIEVSAADCAVIDCEYRDSTGQATDVLITTAAADRLLVDGFTVFGAAGAGCNSAIALVGADDTEIKNCYLYGNFAVGAIDLRTTLSARIRVHDCLIWTENSADIAVVDTITSSTGTVGPNIYVKVKDNADNFTEVVTGATLQVFDPVYVCNLVNEKGALIDWTASTSA